MVWLIDADALREQIEQQTPLFTDSKFYDDLGERLGFERIAGYIVDKQPTIEAVPVIRCKDCKHYFPEGHVRCWNIRGMHYPVEPDEFCSRAERREDG